VANLNLAVANVALPDIGKAFDAGQSAINLVAVGYSLGLATSVLYLGALGDRYGRKLMLILGTAQSMPASLLAALALSIEVLFGARLLGGLAAGMAYPTTLALITVLWSGPARTKSIALWVGRSFSGCFRRDDPPSTLGRVGQRIHRPRNPTSTVPLCSSAMPRSAATVRVDHSLPGVSLLRRRRRRVCVAVAPAR
jgi:hypothetical protein